MFHFCDSVLTSTTMILKCIFSILSVQQQLWKAFCACINNFEFSLSFFSLESRFRLINETIIAKEEQQIKADFLTLKKILMFEENVRNLSIDVSNNKADNSKASTVILSSVNSLKPSVKWILNFIEDLTQRNGQNRTGNSTVFFRT